MLAVQGKVKTLALAEFFEVSEPTIRQIADLSEISGIITDACVSENVIRRYEQADVSIILKAGDSSDHHGNTESGSGPDHHPQ